MSSCNVHFEKKVVEFVKKHKLKSLCDYGCGDGSGLERLADSLATDVSLIGIDYFSRFREDKRPKPSEKFELIDRDGEEYKTFLNKKESMDLVLSSYALHHYEYPVTELQAIASLLREGGYLYLWDFLFVREEPVEILQSTNSFLHEAGSALVGAYHRHHYTLEQAVDLIKGTPLVITDSGLEKIDIPEGETEEENREAIKRIDKSVEAVGKNVEKELLKDYLLTLLEFHKKYFLVYGTDYSSVFSIVARK